GVSIVSAFGGSPITASSTTAGARYAAYLGNGEQRRGFHLHRHDTFLAVVRDLFRGLPVRRIRGPRLPFTDRQATTEEAIGESGGHPRVGRAFAPGAT